MSDAVTIAALVAGGAFATINTGFLAGIFLRLGSIKAGLEALEGRVLKLERGRFNAGIL